MKSNNTAFAALLVATVIFAIFFAPLSGTPALAQSSEPAEAEAEEVDLDRVIARVNGVEITLGEVRLAIEGMGQQARQMPPQQQLTQVVSVLTDIELVAKKAIEEGLEDDEGFKRQMALLRRQELAERKLSSVGVDAVTEDAVEAFYSELDAERQEEVRARHILVATEDEAKAVKTEVDGGADFAAVAQEKSTGPSGQNGGDLGYFTKDRMVPPFANAAFSLEPGTVSDPVQTEFGWHVIKVEDKRMQQLPPLEEIRDRVEQAVAQEARQAYLQELRSNAELLVIDADGKEIPFTSEPVEQQ
ncbi:MAG: peptidylprolyl isomerase [Pseudomonadota bacterium]